MNAALSPDLEPSYIPGYPPVVLDLYVSEQSRIAEVTLAAGADIVSVVGLVPPPAPSPRRLVGVFQTGGKHDYFINGATQ